ncbi:TetR/AcrR family transcriptional regulator [Segetibacter koreensis]|uniref:TetR/AcrR family transcriptional regulator n=1 Tax=Segetibacter koreensis TaxID=398037 RepID=UPI000366306C|nr:TetR/AcrR family transcriptional regulator [Segetibacter koreensis]
MGIAERKIRQKEEVRSSILKSAMQIVEKEGWQALSIRKIADAIEYSVPVIYDHFENKEGILLELTRQGFRLLNQRIEKAKSTFSDPAKQLESMAFAYWHFAFDNVEYYKVMYGLGMPGCEMVQQIAELATFTELILSCVKDLIKNSKNHEADAFLKFHTFWSMLHGLISINLMGKENARTELNNMVLNDFIKGFVAGIKG